MKKAFDLLLDIYWVVSVDPPGSFRFRFELVNAAYEREVGISNEEAAGKRPFEIFSKPTAATIVGHYTDCVLNRTTITYAEHLKVKGKWRWWRSTLVPHENADGKIYLIVGTSFPIDELEGQLRSAIAHDKLKVAYQPIVRLQDACINDPHCRDCLVGYEALIRWPGSGYSPADFLPIAVASNLMPLITRKVLFTVVKKLTEIDKRLWIAVNVANCSFEVDLDTALSYSSCVSRDRIPFEITEDTNMTAESIDRFVRLKQLGHPIEFDDFGTHSANLEWLQRVTPDAIKLDLSFVRGVDHLPGKQNICRAAIELAHGYEPRIAVVAEGVETVEELRWLQQQGVEFGQGYLFSKPLWGDEI